MATLRNRAAVLALALAVPFSGIVPDRVQTATSEYEVKAAFLINFAKFVEWPASSFDTATTQLRIGVVGDDPFGVSLDNAARGKVLDGREMAVKRLDWRDDLTGFHI